jgi:hypothetical protein
VPGTGTRYFRRQLPGDGIYHCGASSYNAATQQNVVATTFRDPKRVAACWANAGTNFEAWNECWYWYNKLIKLPQVKVFDFRLKEQHGFVFDGVPIGQHEDKTGLHAALDRNDMDYFYKNLPGDLKLL